MNHGSDPLTQVKTASIFSVGILHFDLKLLLIESIGWKKAIRKYIFLPLLSLPARQEIVTPWGPWRRSTQIGLRIWKVCWPYKLAEFVYSRR